MTEERPDPLVRLDATTEAVAGSRGIVAAEEPLYDALTR